MPTSTSVFFLLTQALSPFQVLLESIAVVRPGSCYTVRGSTLAVHVVVDQKHRVYACITAEDVPFSLGLSLLEEVRSTPLRTFSEQLIRSREPNLIDVYETLLINN